MPLTRGAFVEPRPLDVHEYYRRREHTEGCYTDERESACAFDRAVPTELFEVHHEVRGTLISPRPAQVDRAMRIDRVLVPTSRPLDLGWRFGIVGCELKRSGIKIGPAIAQALDYSRTVWTLEPSKFSIWLDYVFIWPMPKQDGTVASICSQNRLGSAYGDTRYVRFGLKSGEFGLLNIDQDGRVRIGSGIPQGAKAGSR